MARTTSALPPGSGLTDYISLGVLMASFPIETVGEALMSTGCMSQQERLLRAHVMAYYAIALALYADVSTGEVLRCLLEGVRWLGDPGEEGIVGTPGTIAGKSGTSQARTRLGAAPLEALYRAVVEPVAMEGTRGAVVSRMANDEHGRHDAQRRRHQGKCAGLRPTREPAWGKYNGRIPATSHCGIA